MLTTTDVLQIWKAVSDDEARRKEKFEEGKGEGDRQTAQDRVR